MHSRASQALQRAFRTRGAAAQLSKRTGISQSRLSKLASGATETTPTLEICMALKADPEVPIHPEWWLEAPEPEGTEADGAQGAA